MVHTYMKIFFTIHLKFKFNWAFCILPDSSSWDSFSVTFYMKSTTPRPVHSTSPKYRKPIHFSSFLLPPSGSKPPIQETPNRSLCFYLCRNTAYSKCSSISLILKEINANFRFLISWGHYLVVVEL